METFYIKKVQSLGYIAMDDCSGNRFGRHLIRGYYFNQMPADLAKEFEEEYNVEPDYIKKIIVQRTKSKCVLLNICKFLIKHKDNDFAKVH
jgi:hypothetical protein